MKQLSRVLMGALSVLFVTGIAMAQMGGQQPQMPAYAQSDDVSDEEIVKFANIAEALDEVQADVDRQVLSAINAEGMSTERFEQIAMAQQDPQAAAQLDLTEEEMEILGKVGPVMQQITMEAQQKVLAKIEEEEMSVERFQMIAMGTQMDAELAQRIEDEFEKRES
ncbi:MAG: DUF4168 domain-containing protein [Bacteroidetes bacterium]|nr:DUF4168 domain-containing protein [Bacteroidota bacterium]MCH8524523.1 DUF4168 domain-containing protein [Balneolales bacterium]